MESPAQKRARLPEQLLNHVTRAPLRPRGAAILLLWVLLIGAGDYYTGTRVSLVVFYLMPIVIATAWYGPRAGVLTALGSILVRSLGDLLLTRNWEHELWFWWNPVASVLIYLLMVWIIHYLLTLHRRLEARVQERTQELEDEIRRRQGVQAELLEISARERNAMGRELHDQLGQHLVGTAMAAQVLAQRLATGPEGAAREARAIADLVESGIAQTRQLARGLLLEAIEPDRLGAELEELCGSLTRQSGNVSCHFRREGRPLAPDAASAAQLYRIAQEAMSNAMRHSGARRVDLVFAGERDSLCLVVEDNGRGLPAAEARGPGMGLRIMQHRAASIGGGLSAISGPGGGTRIVCCLPAAAAERFFATP